MSLGAAILSPDLPVSGFFNELATLFSTLGNRMSGSAFFIDKDLSAIFCDSE